MADIEVNMPDSVQPQPVNYIALALAPIYDPPQPERPFAEIVADVMKPLPGVTLQTAVLLLVKNGDDELLRVDFDGTITVRGEVVANV